MTVWRQFRSSARPVVVLGVVAFGVAWVLSWRWSEASLSDWGWLWTFRFRYGFGTGGLHVASLVAGWVLVGLGLVWFWWPELTFIANGLTLAPEDPPDRLVTWGPFRYCTSPMFFGVVCGLYGEAFLVNQWLFVWATLFTLWVTQWYLPYKEEPRLRVMFGDRWVEYSSPETPGATFRGILPLGLFSRRYRYQEAVVPQAAAKGRAT